MNSLEKENIINEEMVINDEENDKKIISARALIAAITVVGVEVNLLI